ncbi:MAG: preprotein translocase subunit SecE [Alphaproteobacteria bacterium]|nr:MAG: preprotein translocase subunit SecE [Alphaproteobacteria bacterium]TAE79990.1 MAG: preprotein translocase subunit SecE [Alphaproteobacteria bacterium]TAF14375.1 MAG: preprotein translocase subunit SecE [Alphaproteobacteria bacterium]TAF41482.1 MAG: preprotein translocase subunit SecE [Alphaproteobacteria bacterium]TAF75715.1 MAG: preprotein translocase subunit SecE [Alphaproteobacteria bacterium]
MDCAVQTTQKEFLVNPAKFVREVKQESRKIIWPTRKEALVSVVMVLVLASVTSLFFVLVDGVIAWMVKAILGIGA